MSIAEDVLTGLQCSHCGVCFEEESGFPVLCEDCFREQAINFYNEWKEILDDMNSTLIPKSKFKELGNDR